MASMTILEPSNDAAGYLRCLESRNYARIFWSPNTLQPASENWEVSGPHGASVEGVGAMAR